MHQTSLGVGSFCTSQTRSVGAVKVLRTSLDRIALLQMHAVQIHTNVIGGMTMMEPASDLAVAVAIASSFYEQPIARDIACIGEIGKTQLPAAAVLNLLQALALQ